MSADGDLAVGDLRAVRPRRPRGRRSARRRPSASRCRPRRRPDRRSHVAVLELRAVDRAVGEIGGLDVAVLRASRCRPRRRRGRRSGRRRPSASARRPTSPSFRSAEATSPSLSFAPSTAPSARSAVLTSPSLSRAESTAESASCAAVTAPAASFSVVTAPSASAAAPTAPAASFAAVTAPSCRCAAPTAPAASLPAVTAASARSALSTLPSTICLDSHLDALVLARRLVGALGDAQSAQRGLDDVDLRGRRGCREQRHADGDGTMVAETDHLARVYRPASAGLSDTAPMSPRAARRRDGAARRHTACGRAVRARCAAVRRLRPRPVLRDALRLLRLQHVRAGRRSDTPRPRTRRRLPRPTTACRRALPAGRCRARGGRPALVRDLELGRRRPRPLRAQPRLLALARLVGARPRRALARRRRALVERPAPGPLRRRRGSGRSPAAGRERLTARAAPDRADDARRPARDWPRLDGPVPAAAAGVGCRRLLDRSPGARWTDGCSPTWRELLDERDTRAAVGRALAG